MILLNLLFDLQLEKTSGFAVNKEGKQRDSIDRPHVLMQVRPRCLHCQRQGYETNYNLFDNPRSYQHRPKRIVFPTYG